MSSKPFAYAWRWKGGATWKLTLTKKPNHHPDIEIKELFERRASAAPAEALTSLRTIRADRIFKGLVAEEIYPLQQYVTLEDVCNTFARPIAPADDALIHRAVLDWIRDDTGAAVKMSITRELANKLTARIGAALSEDRT